ncbi:MAG: ABC transporter permease [Anaerolineales bacterium]|nr:ABC transporter permease [Anaerolineales bacterium]
MKSENNNLTGHWDVRRKLEPWISALIVVVILAAWEWLARSERISSLFFPPPTQILRIFCELTANGKLPAHLAATLSRLALGFALGCLPGLFLGLVMGWSPRMRGIVDPIVAGLHPIPKIALFPLILVIFGLGERSRIITIAIGAFFPMLINSMAGVRQINPLYFEVTRNYGASLWKTLTRVIVPGSLPMTLIGARLSLNIALVIAIAVELLAAQQGLGVLIWFAWQTLRIEELYASLITIAALGVGANLAIQRLAGKLTPWYSEQ